MTPGTKHFAVGHACWPPPGMWLLLPRGGQPGRKFGIVLALISLGLFASQIAAPGARLRSTESRLLDTGRRDGCRGRRRRHAPQSRLLRDLVRVDAVGHGRAVFVSGAQFLGVATIVVYAGAILVTFLFVLMLAQPQGHAFYDRVSWEALVSAAVGAVMIGILTMVIGDAFEVRTIASEDETGQYVYA